MKWLLRSAFQSMFGLPIWTTPHVSHGITVEDTQTQEQPLMRKNSNLSPDQSGGRFAGDDFYEEVAPEPRPKATRLADWQYVETVKQCIDDMSHRGFAAICLQLGVSQDKMLEFLEGERGGPPIEKDANGN